MNPKVETARPSFEYHLDKWHVDTMMLSWHDTKHESYRAIVNMGNTAVPLIMEVITEYLAIADAYRGGVWIVCALDDILGMNPIPEEHSGRLTNICQDWVDWYKENKDDISI